jgi:hypothetical protein
MKKTNSIKKQLKTDEKSVNFTEHEINFDPSKISKNVNLKLPD